MTLPISGPISFSDINVELGKNPNSPITLNDTDVRALAGKATGPISLSDLRGKSNNINNITIITGSGYGGDYFLGRLGWSSITAGGEVIAGSANPSPIPMNPYAGTMYALCHYTAGSYMYAYAKNYNGAFYVTVNGKRILMNYHGLYEGFYTFQSAVVANPFLAIGKSNTISFG